MASYEIEVKEIYNRLSRKYHEVTATHFFNACLEVPATMSLLYGAKGKKVLDVGCGTGRHTAVLKKRGAQVWGLDLSPKMIEIAKEKIKGVDFQVGTVYELPYRNGFFDFVLAGLCISYFRNLDVAFGEIGRVLKKNGIFVFSFPNPLLEISTYASDRPREYRKFGDYFREAKIYHNWTTFKVRMPYYHRTLQTLVDAITSNGFSIEKYLEERPIEDGRKRYPELFRVYSKIPYFCAFRVRRT